MIKSISISRQFFIFGVPVFLMLVLVLLPNSNFFKIHPSELSLAITIDFLITIPVIYFFLIRKTKIGKRSVLTLLSIGILMASLIIPKENQQYLSLFKKWLFPILEIGIFGYLFISIKNIIVNFKSNQTLDFFESLKMATNSILPIKNSGIINGEIGVIYYGFFARKNIQFTDNEYTYHKNNSTITILYFFIFIILLESSIIHLLVAKYSIFWAWILTGLSIYTAIQIWGLTSSIKKRPIKFEKEYVKLFYGIFCETKINFNKIIEIKSIKNIIADKEIVQMSPLKSLEEPNVLIKLSEENWIEKLYGGKKAYKKLALYVDDNERFIENINQQITRK